MSYALGVPAAWEFTRKLLLALAPKMEQAGHRHDWLPYLERATDLSEQLGDLASAAEFMLQRGILHRLLSEFGLAKSQLEHSIALCERIAAPRRQARALNELAWVESLQNQTITAAQLVDHALVLLDVNDPERAMCYRVQGMLAIAHAQWSEAEVLHRQALAIFEKQGDARKVAWSLQNLAYALRGQERFEEAIGYYAQAAESLWYLGDHYNWSIVQVNLGLAYHYSGRPALAVDRYLEAKSIPGYLCDTFHLARIHLNIGLSYLTLQLFAEAEEAFGAAIRLHRESGVTFWRLNAMDGLAMTYIGWGKFAQASTVLEQAIKELPTIVGVPYYEYLFRSLHQHLEEAHKGEIELV
ncbi:MAG: tetratricopeptide repeat protein [Caldilineaceae bacterium]